MNNQKSSSLVKVLSVATILILSACQAVAPTTDPDLAKIPTTLEPVVVPPAEEPTQALNGNEAIFTLNYSPVAQDIFGEEVEAQAASADGPYWEAAPQYHKLTLQGYKVTNLVFKPQIFIYPIEDMASANKSMNQVALDLQALLQNRKTGDKMPYLPLSSDTQVMHTQVRYLDFSCSKGVRFLTQFNNGIASINNSQLIYTFQGLTCDGKYYISAVLPVTSPELPDNPSVDDAMMSDFQGYISNAAAELDQLSADQFSPSLDTLDEMIRSIEVK